MNILVLYFSLTGNTKKVAKSIPDVFIQKKHSVTCIPITENISDLNKYDLIGIGSPTFESHAPTPVKNYLKAIPNLPNKNAFIFSTSSGASGNTISDISKILNKKGLNVIDKFLSPGEMFHPAPCIKGKSKGHPNLIDLNNSIAFSNNLLIQIKNKNSSPFNGLKPKKGFYNVIGKVTSSERLIRLLVPKPKYNPLACINCKKCIKNCPMRNLTNNGVITLGKNCIRCYHCMNSCKKKAFSVNWWFGNTIILLFWNKYFMKWFGEYKNEN